MSDLAKLSAKIAKRGATAMTVGMLLSAAAAFAAGNVDEGRSTLTSLQTTAPTDTASGTDRVLTAKERTTLLAEKDRIRQIGRDERSTRPARLADGTITPHAPGSRAFQISAATDLIDAASLVSRGLQISADQLVQMTLASTDATISTDDLWDRLAAPIDRVGKPLISLDGPGVPLFGDLSANGIHAA